MNAASVLHREATHGRDTAMARARRLRTLKARTFLVWAVTFLLLLSAAAGYSLAYWRLRSAEEEITDLHARLKLLRLAEIGVIAVARQDAGGVGGRTPRESLAQLDGELVPWKARLRPEERQALEASRTVMMHPERYAEFMRTDYPQLAELMHAYNNRLREVLVRQRNAFYRFVHWIMLGVFLLLLSLLIVLGHNARKLIKGFDFVTRKIGLISQGRNTADLPIANLDPEIHAISSALDGMQQAIEASRVQSEIACHMSTLRERLHGMMGMALGIVHKVGNPLTAMKGSIELLEDCWRRARAEAEPGWPDACEVEQCFGILREQTARIASLLNQLNELNAAYSPSRSPVNVNELLQAIVALAQFDKRASDIAFALDLDRTIPAAVGGEEYIALSLVNVIEVAIDRAVGHGGQIRIGTRHDSERIWANIALDERAGKQPAPPPGFPRTAPPGNRAAEQSADFLPVKTLVESNGGLFRLEEVPAGGYRVELAFPRNAAIGAVSACRPPNGACSAVKG